VLILKRALESRTRQVAEALLLALHRSGDQLPRADSAATSCKWRCRSASCRWCAPKGSSGVIFTLDTRSRFRDVVTISGTYGLARARHRDDVDDVTLGLSLLRDSERTCAPGVFTRDLNAGVTARAKPTFASSPPTSGWRSWMQSRTDRRSVRVVRARVAEVSRASQMRADATEHVVKPGQLHAASTSPFQARSDRPQARLQVPIDASPISEFLQRDKMATR
jgi:hypothetical protein